MAGRAKELRGVILPRRIDLFLPEAQLLNLLPSGYEPDGILPEQSGGPSENSGARPSTLSPRLCLPVVPDQASSNLLILGLHALWPA